MCPVAGRRPRLAVTCALAGNRWHHALCESHRRAAMVRLQIWKHDEYLAPRPSPRTVRGHCTLFGMRPGASWCAHRLLLSLDRDRSGGTYTRSSSTCPREASCETGAYNREARSASGLPQVKRDGGTLYPHEPTPHGGRTCLRSTRAHLAFRAGRAPRPYRAHTCALKSLSSAKEKGDGKNFCNRV